MKTIKAWGLKQDIRYHLYQYPREVLWLLLHGVSLRLALEYAQSRADMRCGRFYRVVFD